ncbi:hypothetical protein A6R68_21128 [Neotoma lepida]|uniref:Uncharacterized protein n=1 Tax=Neotoma lepida TaxID=56216 RepID=A0A1A6HSH2_NEOLE|nr:hypothetical protein A6R68_21128 [Neotoma lepida]
MAARAAEGKQEAGSTQRRQQQQQQPPRAPAGRQAGDGRAGKSAGQAYTSMLASAEWVLAPGHRLAMKGSIMNLFLLPLSSRPARRARLPRVPTLRKGKRGLRATARGMNAGQGRQPVPSAVRSFLGRRSARPRPAAGLVQAPRRCAAGPTEPALSGPGGPIAPNAQETHVLTCEVELLVPSVREQGFVLVQEGTGLLHAQPEEHNTRQGPKHVPLGTTDHPRATSWSGAAGNATSLEYFRATQGESQPYKARAHNLGQEALSTLPALRLLLSFCSGRVINSQDTSEGPSRATIPHLVWAEEETRVPTPGANPSGGVGEMLSPPPWLRALSWGDMVGDSSMYGMVSEPSGGPFCSSCPSAS